MRRIVDYIYIFLTPKATRRNDALRLSADDVDGIGVCFFLPPERRLCRVLYLAVMKVPQWRARNLLNLPIFKSCFFTLNTYIGSLRNYVIF
jgi:hypothetical protein